MEVHAHTHTARKKWTHYFWEFLMLFLAVFCGFLAENQREHMVEHQREKKYIFSLLEDLRNDSFALDVDIIGWQETIKNIDTIRNELSKPAIAQDPAVLNKIAASFYEISTFRHSIRTIEQLRNSGNFRLLKRNVSDLLMLYDSKINTSIRDREMVVLDIYMKLIEYQNNLFDSRVLKQLADFGYNQADSLALVGKLNYAIPVQNKEMLFQYLNQLYFYQNRISSLLYQQQMLNGISIDLKKEINDHY